MIFVSTKFLLTGTIDFTIWSITSNPRIQEPFASMTFKTAFMPNSIFRRYSICMIDKTWRKNRPRFDGFFIIQKRNTYYILNIIYLHNADSLGHREPELCDQLWMEWYDRFCKYQKNTFIIFVFFHTWIRYIIFFTSVCLRITIEDFWECFYHTLNWVGIQGGLFLENFKGGA